MKRTKQINFRVTDLEYKTFERVARNKNQKVPKYIYKFLIDSHQIKIPLNNNCSSSFQSDEKKKLGISFNKKQYEVIKSDAHTFGFTMSDLIKDIYFKKGELKRNIKIEDAKKIIYEINKIGNNLNQIAKKLNEGKDIDPSETLSNLVKQLEEIKIWALS